MAVALKGTTCSMELLWSLVMSCIIHGIGQIAVVTYRQHSLHGAALKPCHELYYSWHRSDRCCDLQAPRSIWSSSEALSWAVLTMTQVRSLLWPTGSMRSMELLWSLVMSRIIQTEVRSLLWPTGSTRSLELLWSLVMSRIIHDIGQIAVVAYRQHAQHWAALSLCHWPYIFTHDSSRQVTVLKARLACALTFPAGHEIDRKHGYLSVPYFELRSDRLRLDDSWLTTSFSFRPAKEICACCRCYAYKSKNKQTKIDKLESMHSTAGTHIIHMFSLAFVTVLPSFRFQLIFKLDLYLCLTFGFCYLVDFTSWKYSDPSPCVAIKVSFRRSWVKINTYV